MRASCIGETVKPQLQSPDKVRTTAISVSLTFIFRPTLGPDFSFQYRVHKVHDFVTEVQVIQNGPLDTWPKPNSGVDCTTHTQQDDMCKYPPTGLPVFKIEHNKPRKVSGATRPVAHCAVSPGCPISTDSVTASAKTKLRARGAAVVIGLTFRVSVANLVLDCMAEHPTVHLCQPVEHVAESWEL